MPQRTRAHLTYVDIIKAVMAALNRRDWHAALSYTAPDCKYDGSRNSGEWHGIYEGREEVKRVWQGFFEQWESSRTEIDEFVQVGGNVLVTDRPFSRSRRDRGNGSHEHGLDLPRRCRERGRSLRRDDALEAAGLEE